MSNTHLTFWDKMCFSMIFASFRASVWEPSCLFYVFLGTLFEVLFFTTFEGNRVTAGNSGKQQETAAALRESTSQTRIDQQITRNQQLRLNAAKDAAASFDRQIAQLVGLQALQKLDARQQALLNQLQDDKARAVRAAVGPIDAEIDRLSGVNSNSGSKLSPKEDAALNKYPSKGQ